MTLSHSEQLHAVVRFQSVVLERFLAHSRFYQQNFPSHTTPAFIALYRACHERLLTEEAHLLATDPAASGVLRVQLQPAWETVQVAARTSLNAEPPILDDLVAAFFQWRHWYRQCLLRASCRRAELEGA